MIVAAEADWRAKIDAEAAVLRTFVALLEEEQRLLVNGNIDRLPDLVEEKNRTAAALGVFAEQRSAMLAAHGLSADRAGMDAWLAAQRADSNAFALWLSLVALAERAYELNRLNGELIEARQQQTAHALAALRSSRSSSADTYGRDGRSSDRNPRHIRESA